MAEKRWEFKLDEIKHVVELEHGYFSGKRSIRIDGRLLPMSPAENQQVVDYGSKHSFEIGSHTCAVIIAPHGLKFEYDLEVDGSSIVTGQSTDMDKIQIRELANSRWGVAVFLILLGLGAGWINWNWAHTKGFFSEEIAFITPLPIALAIYYILFPQDYVDQFRGKLSFRTWVAIVIIILLGVAHAYLFGHGIY